MENYIIRGYDVRTTFLLDFLIPEWDIEPSPYLCGKRLATVHPDGTVASCIREHSFKSGTIFDADPLKAIQCDLYHNDFGKPDIPEECRRCDVRTACQGGCPQDKLLLTGTRAGKSVLCEIHREIIPKLRYLNHLKKSGFLETTIERFKDYLSRGLFPTRNPGRRSVGSRAIRITYYFNVGDFKI